MKILILDNIPSAAGELTYSRHLKAGFEELGHTCDIVHFSKTGRQLKSYTDPATRIEKITERERHLDEADIIVLANGFYKAGENIDYTFLTPFKDKCLFIEHCSGYATQRNYQIDKLLEQVGKIPIVAYPKYAHDYYKTHHDVDVIPLRIPVSKSLYLPQSEKQSENKPVFVAPHRFVTSKHPDTIYNFVTDELTDLDYKMVFYGKATGTAIFWSSLINSVDESIEWKQSTQPFMNKKVELKPEFTHLDLPDIYANATLAMHATKFKYDGGRFEYSILEAIHYGVVACSADHWAKPKSEHIVDEWIENETYLPMNAEAVKRFLTDKSFAENLLTKSQEVLAKHDAKTVAQTMIDIMR